MKKSVAGLEEMASSLSGAPSLAGGSTAVVRGLEVTGAAAFGAPVSISHGFQGGAPLTGTGSVSMTGMDLPAEIDINNSTPANGSAMVVNGLRVRFPHAGNAPGAQVRGLRLETGDGGNYNRADIGFVSAGNTGPANTFNFLQMTIPPCTTGGLFLRAPPGDPALARVGVNKSAPNVELDVTGSGHFSGNVAIDGALTIAGSTTVINSNVTVMSEQLSITNAGTGPALLVTQTGVQQLARFVDDAVGNVFVIHSGGGVSIGSGTAPAAGTALAVTGTLSATTVSCGGLFSKTGTPTPGSLNGGPFFFQSGWSAAGSTHNIDTAVYAASGSDNSCGVLYIFAKIPQASLSGGSGVMQFAFAKAFGYNANFTQIGATVLGGGLSTLSMSASGSLMVVTTDAAASISWMIVGSS